MRGFRDGDDDNDGRPDGLVFEKSAVEARLTFALETGRRIPGTMAVLSGRWSVRKHKSKRKSSLLNPHPV